MRVPLLIFREVSSAVCSSAVPVNKKTILVCRMSEDIELGMAEIQRIMQVKSALATIC